MARPTPTGKQSVNLAARAPRVSRIRRDPPPVVKEKVVYPDVVDRRDVVIGVLAFALAVFVIIFAFGSYSGWSPREYTVEWNAADEVPRQDRVSTGPSGGCHRAGGGGRLGKARMDNGAAAFRRA